MWRQERIGCAEFRRQLALDRRAFIKSGVLAFAGLKLSDLLRWEARAALPGKSVSRQNSVIILWMRGGPSHIDMWDPKPDAPIEIRGEFRTIPTKVPGIQLTELLPLSARMMDKWSIIRSLYHDDAGHSSGDQICFTGYPAGRDPEQNAMPSCGSIVAKQLQAQSPGLPAYVMIPKKVPGAGAAYLGAPFDPFETIADPARTGSFQVPNFTLPAGISMQRLAGRRELLDGLDRLRRDVDETGKMEAMDEFQRHAWEMVSGQAARQAFDLDAEPAKMRERYGIIPEFKAPTPDRCGVPAWSQRLLLARRLVEAGVRLVTVDVRWWDTHVQNFDSLRNGFLPRWDRAFSALIGDLEERGLLDTTMVLAWGEFGRTPQINAQAGRDHWPGVFSAGMAGGGIQGGRVVGSSDDKGTVPASNPKTPQDVLATIYRHLGIDTKAQYADLAGRPHPVLSSGEPIAELF